MPKTMNLCETRFLFLWNYPKSNSSWKQLPEAIAADWKTLRNKKLWACNISHQIGQSKELDMDKHEGTKCILDWKLYEKK
jgi:hypothetical protein